MGNVKIGDWLSEAWTIISEDLVTHILLALIVGLGSGLTGGLLSGPLMGGYLWIVFNKMKNPSYTPQVGDVGKGFENFVQLFLVAIVGGIIASLGVIGCIVGVFFTSALVVLALPLVVERNMAFWPAISESMSRTKQSLMGLGRLRARSWPAQRFGQRGGSRLPDHHAARDDGPRHRLSRDLRSVRRRAGRGRSGGAAGADGASRLRFGRRHDSVTTRDAHEAGTERRQSAGGERGHRGRLAAGCLFRRA